MTEEFRGDGGTEGETERERGRDRREPPWRMREGERQRREPPWRMRERERARERDREESLPGG